MRSWALLKGIDRRKDIVCSGEGTGIQVDGGIVVEVQGDFRQFVLLGSGTSDIEVNQVLEFFGT